MKIHINGIVEESVTDGPGFRYVIFTQGCPHNCPGCHNPQTHSFAGGDYIDSEEILAQVQENPLLQGVTFSGGEPFCQAGALAKVGEEIHALGLNIWTYTGYLYENLLKRAETEPEIGKLLAVTDVLVDGPFVLGERDLTLQFRGSRNQRVLDLSTTRAKN